MRKRNRDAAALLARREAAYRRVHPSPEPDVASLVRAEVERQRAADTKAATEAEEAKYRGGPCVLCGGLESRQATEEGETVPGWQEFRAGQQVCAWCARDYIEGSPMLDDALDLVAAVLRAEGLAGLRIPNRLYFSGIQPGLAAELGVGAWAESGQPPGERWSHLVPVEERLAHERANEPPKSIRSWDEVIVGQPGWEPRWDYGMSEEERARAGTSRTISDAEVARMDRRYRQQQQRREQREGRSARR